MPMEASDLMVILKDKEEWTSAKTFNELAEKMGKALGGCTGNYHRFSISGADAF
jgi:cobalt-zinc-cadmium resistance protein CzcA